MLQQALNRHSRIVIPPETKFFYYFYGQSAGCQRWILRRIKRDLRIELPGLGRRVRTPAVARAVYEEIACRYVERLGRDGVVWFGEKTPEQTSQLWRIRQVFPEAKLIIMWRDGRDVALSLSRMPWVRCDVYVGFVIWLYYWRALRRCVQEGLFETHEVRYEDVVRDAAGQLAKVLEFLGLEYERPVAEGYGNREGIPERELPWKGRALEPITPDRAGRWRRELLPVQVARLECLGTRALEQLGYELSGPAPARLSPWFLLRLTCGIANCVAHLPLRFLAISLQSRLQAVAQQAQTPRLCHGPAEAGTTNH